MRIINEAFLHNISGCQNIMMPEGYLILSAQYSQNGFAFYYEADKDLELHEINLYLLTEGDIVPENFKYITSVFDKKLLQTVHIYQQLKQ